MKREDERDLLKQQIRDHFAEYADILAEILVESKDLGSESEVHQRLFRMYGESLCYRDELDAYVSSKSCESSQSLLHCEALDDYRSVFKLLESPSSLSSPGRPRDDPHSAPTLPMSASLNLLISRYLRMFGKVSCTGAPSEKHTWVRIQSALFPDLSPESLRVSYYKYQREHMEVSSDVVLPRRWTFDEDSVLVSCIETCGRGDLGIHHTYLALHERRSHDEIVARVGMYFPRPKKEYKKSKGNTSSGFVTTRAPSESGNDSWGQDDALLESG